MTGLDFFIGMVTGALWTAIMLSAVFSALRADDPIVVVKRQVAAVDPIGLILDQAWFLMEAVGRR